MSTLLLGDLHLGNHKWEGGELINGVNRRCRELLTAMRAAVDDAMAISPDLSAVVQVGDFFDQSRPDPAVVHAALELMRSYPNLDWHLMVGNHDLRAFGAPSALAPLGHVPGIHVYDRPTQIELSGLHYCLIPYISHSAKDALEMSRSVAHHADVLVLHYGVVSEASRPDQISKQDISFYCVGQASRNPWIISGHEHGERTAGDSGLRAHYQCVGLGSFADLDWSASRFGLPHAAILRLDGTLRCDPVNGPHFTKPGWDVDSPHWQRQLLDLAINSRGRGLYVEVQADQADYAKVLQSTGLIQGWRVTPEKGTAATKQAPATERMGFGDLESPIAEVLDSRGEDLSDETTHRVWSRCLAHMKEK